MCIVTFSAFFLDGFVDNLGVGHLRFHALVTSEAEIAPLGYEQVLVL